MSKPVSKKIEKLIDNSFVDNYDTIVKYKDNFNEILRKMEINDYQSYNEFCYDIKDVIIDKISNNKITYSENYLSEIIVDTLKNKIKKDKNYKRKILKYFDDITVIEAINE
jgi:hypothetical protein